MLLRHSIDAMIMHWFNTICWILLLMTGIGLVDNPVLQPLGMWWVRVMQAVFGDGASLLEFHIAVGTIWTLGFTVYGSIRFKRMTLPFVKEMLTFSPRTDIEWLIKKSLSMTLGPRMMQRFGLETTIPDQGFYNVGQKLFGICALFVSPVIAISGWTMTFSKQDWMDPVWVQWSILIHFIFAGLMLAGLLIHIYMATIAKGKTPALISMFSGYVPEAYARSHHRHWFETIRSRQTDPEQ